jgi:threonine/homoserine/homoserine lactone efflux protein
MFILVGLIAGAVTGVPIGPVNVAVIDAAYRHTLRRAIAVGLGGACADGLYSALGVLGVTPALRTYPTVPPILYGVSGVVLLAYGFMTARSKPVTPHPDEAAKVVEQSREMRSGFTLGLALILLNPAAIVTWVVVMGAVVEQIADFDQITPLNGIMCSLGVVVGSFGWFALVAYLTQKGKTVLGNKAAWIPRVIGVALMVYAVYLIAKAVKYVIA